MSKRRRRRPRKRCTRAKVQHSSEAAARAEAIRLRRKFAQVGWYRCADHWHVGHLPYWKRQSIAARRRMGYT